MTKYCSTAYCIGHYFHEICAAYYAIMHYTLCLLSVEFRLAVDACSALPPGNAGRADSLQEGHFLKLGKIGGATRTWLPVKVAMETLWNCTILSVIQQIMC